MIAANSSQQQSSCNRTALPVAPLLMSGLNTCLQRSLRQLLVHPVFFGTCRGFTPEVLNARPDSVQREAAIIAQAGLPRRSPYGDPALTISTSMAGRGTDIRLGGDPPGLMRLGLQTLLLPHMIKGPFHPFARSACSVA